MMGVFGQGKAEKRNWSPNGGYIRTGEGGEKELESEWRVYSDRARRRNGIGVRMKVVFGQSKVENWDESPNGEYIRTGQG
jgi:hypothetical protein